ncbi:hypothetical protein K488DRAFT_92326 [Vararia minispora EC-137]|uniref:Uncharacterized protein n=1 Tax=Vararia minispora EC-137 TaxID=1314806 RepID=A0ACB8Q4F7_9AGAM|nr:hypothetical protein K488DRAFT_92326 [Vararia minispora EC-137]
MSLLPIFSGTLIAVPVWSFTLKPGEPQPFAPLFDVVITNIALGDELEDQNARTTVKLSHPSSPVTDGPDEAAAGGGTIESTVTVLCSLIPGKIEQATVNITLEGGEEYLLQAVGKNTVFLTGKCYIDSDSSDSEPSDSESVQMTWDENFGPVPVAQPGGVDATEDNEDDEDDSQ